MYKLTVKLRIFLTLILVFNVISAHADDIPNSWKRTMTNDPSTNYFLARVVVPLGNKDAELLRTVILSLVAIRYCKDVHVDDTVAQPFLTQNGYYTLRGKKWSDAQFAARDNLRNVTHREIAHLCAGLDYLFGPKGKMAPHLLIFGTTGPKYPFDPRNQYISLPELPKPKS
jgi:hypothetical protein